MGCVKDKPILIIFEGVDKSGKTTLKDAFNKLTNFKYVVLDRLTTSSKVYAKYFCRSGLEYYENFENVVKKNFNVLVVCCICDEQIIRRRLMTSNEVLPKQLENINELQKEFLDEVSRTFNNFIILDTSSKDVKECVDEICSKVKNLEGF